MLYNRTSTSIVALGGLALPGVMSGFARLSPGEAVRVVSCRLNSTSKMLLLANCFGVCHLMGHWMPLMPHDRRAEMKPKVPNVKPVLYFALPFSAENLRVAIPSSLSSSSSSPSDAECNDQGDSSASNVDKESISWAWASCPHL